MQVFQKGFRCRNKSTTLDGFRIKVSETCAIYCCMAACPLFNWEFKFKTRSGALLAFEKSYRMQPPLYSLSTFTIDSTDEKTYCDHAGQSNVLGTDTRTL